MRPLSGATFPGFPMPDGTDGRSAWAGEVLNQSRLRVEELEAALETAASLAREALDDEEFVRLKDTWVWFGDPMTGPASRGYFERILDATTRAAGKGD